jgi:hypothetical protein
MEKIWLWFDFSSLDKYTTIGDVLICLFGFGFLILICIANINNLEDRIQKLERK